MMKMHKLNNKSVLIGFFGGTVLSCVIVLFLGWNTKRLSTTMTVVGFAVLALSFFSGWGHAKLDSSGYHAGMVDEYREEKDKMYGILSLNGIISALLLWIFSLLVFYI